MGGDRDQAALTHHAVRLGEVIENVEDRHTVEGLVGERKRGCLASNAPGRGPVCGNSLS